MSISEPINAALPGASAMRDRVPGWVLGGAQKTTERAEPPVDSSLDSIVRLACRSLGAPCASIIGFDGDVIIGHVHHEPGFAALADWSGAVRSLERASHLEPRMGTYQAEPAQAALESGSSVPVPLSFAAMPLLTVAGEGIGQISVLDLAPRAWTEADLGTLREMTELAAARLEERQERRRLQTALDRAEAHYHRLVESSPYPVFVVDLAGRITELNSSGGEIMGVAREDAIGRPFRDLVDVGDDGRSDRAFQDLVTGTAQVMEVEVAIVRSDGERRQVLTRYMPIRDGGEVVGIHGMARDVTEERAREAELRRAERLSSLSTLLGGVAHELNNPLTSIKSFSQLMLLDERSADDQESLEVIHREADRAAKIVSDLRLMARQSNGNDSDRAVLDLNELVRAVLKKLRANIESKGIDLRQDLTRDPLPVFGQRAQLEQMVLNLVLNAELAAQSATAEPRIIVRTRPSRRGLAFAVIDSGNGIPPDHLDRIFDPFWTTRSPGQGIGLGLSVVHSIVSDHGGEVRVESEVGRGSAFTVDLPWPLVGVDSTPAPLREHPKEETRLRILIVDDEAPIRLSLARYLERRGHDVADAENGRRALWYLDNSEPFDLIVSDLRMPGFGGDALFRRLRLREDGSERRVVFITGDASGLEDEPHLRESGALVVQKPFALGELSETLERHAAMLRSGIAREA